VYVFTRAKSNIPLDGCGFHYTISGQAFATVLATSSTPPALCGVNAGEGNARSILSGIEGEDNVNKPINRVEEAMRFLRAEIEHGPAPARELIERAKRDFGINERSLQRAREKMGIVATKVGYQGAWVWSSRVTFRFPG
jgi:putative DNA primase/helicase